MTLNKHFSKEIFINNWKRLFFIPMVLFWILFFAGPYSFYMNIRNYQNMQDRLDVKEFLWAFSASIEALRNPIFLMIVVIVPVMAVFYYLYNVKSTYMIHAFPVTRKSLYITNITSGLLMIILPIIIVAVILTPMINGYFPGYASMIWEAVGQGVLEILFYFGLGTLIGMITGSFIVLPILYFIANFIYVILYTLVSALYEPFVFGWSPWEYDNFLFSPVVYITNFGEGNFNEKIGYLIAVAVVGIVFLLVGYFVYKKHNVEAAGEPVPISWLRPVFRWGISFCGCACMILLLLELARLYSRPSVLALYLAVFVIFGFVIFIIVQMILKRSFKVLSKPLIKEYAAMAVVFIVLSLVIYTDPIGVENKVPDKSDIKGATLQVGDSDTITLSDEETEAILSIHKDIVENKNTLLDQEIRINTWYYYENKVPPEWQHIDVCYTLNNGKHLYRYYKIIQDDNKETDSILERAAGIIDTPENIMSQIFKDEYNDKLSLSYMEIYLNPEDEDFWDEYSDTSGSIYIEDTSERKLVIEAMKKDILAGFAKKALNKDVLGSILMEYSNPREDVVYYEEAGRFVITNECLNTLEAINKLGYGRL